MRRGRLPLTALRSFEAAGRHLSFTRAADELAVSQAAVSRQVRELETLLGLKLFERRHRAVVLTEAGTALLARVTEGFDLIAGALAGVRADAPQAVIRVSTEPTFAAMWLVPHLAEFGALRPDIEVLVEPEVRVEDFRASGCDLAVRFSNDRSDWPRSEARLLGRCFDTPLLAPELAASVRTPADLAAFTLLNDDGRGYWPAWFAAAGVPEIALGRGPLLPDAAFAVQAARMGQGVALMDPRFVADDLAAGRLVRPFETGIPHGAYWLVAPSFARLGAAAAAFADWLAADTAALLAA